MLRTFGCTMELWWKCSADVGKCRKIKTRYPPQQNKQQQLQQPQQQQQQEYLRWTQTKTKSCTNKILFVLLIFVFVWKFCVLFVAVVYAYGPKTAAAFLRFFAFVLQVLLTGLLRYVLYTCPNLWERSFPKCDRMDCFGTCDDDNDHDDDNDTDNDNDNDNHNDDDFHDAAASRKGT